MMASTLNIGFLLIAFATHQRSRTQGKALLRSGTGQLADF